jgi:hypothetical protein
MPRPPEQIAAEEFKLRPHTPQIFVMRDDSGWLRAFKPDHATGGVIEIATDSDTVASFQKMWTKFIAEENSRVAEDQKLREREMRSFDCPLKVGSPESRCTEAGKAGCSRTRCVTREREDNASRRHQQEMTARAARGDARQSRRTKAPLSISDIRRILANVKL